MPQFPEDQRSQQQQQQQQQERMSSFGEGITAARSRVQRYDPKKNRVVSPNAQKAAESLGIDVNAQTEPLEESMQAAPMYFKVPACARRLVGRDKQLMFLWQSLLSGKRCHLITGVDGIGKSSMACEFADACRRTTRFTCIQWFDAQDSLPSRLKEFYATVQGRLERDVMFIFDNVTDLASVAQYIPTNDSFHTVITMPVMDTSSMNANRDFLNKYKAAIFPCTPLDPNYSKEIVQMETLDPEVERKVCDYLANCPLLLRVAHHLLGSGEVTTPEELAKSLEDFHGKNDGVISISQTLQFLINMGIAKMEKEFENVNIRDALTLLSCLNVENLSTGIIRSAIGDERGDDFAATAAAVGIFEPHLESDGWIMHPSVARSLRQDSSNLQAHIDKAITYITEDWPRRMRGHGLQHAWHLVKHVEALQKVIPEGKVTPEAVQLMNKAAMFLAHTEGKELALAAQLWKGVLDALATPAASTAMDAEEAAIVSLDYGRVLSRLGRHEQATVALNAALERCRAAFGEASVEAATATAATANYLPDAVKSLQLVKQAASALEHALDGSSAKVYGIEEVDLHRRNLFGLLVRTGQLIEALDQGPVPPSLWKRLEALHKEITGSQEDKSTDSTATPTKSDTKTTGR